MSDFQASISSRGSSWAALPVDLWQQVALAASLLDPEPGSEAEPKMPRLQDLRVLSTMSVVCKSMRQAVIGPGAELLWERPRFMSSHHGLSLQQSCGLNRLQIRRCQALSRIERLILRGDGWEDADLDEVCAILPRAIKVLDVRDMHNENEAGNIAEGLLDASVKHLAFQGSCPIYFPNSVRKVDVRARFASEPSQSEASTIARRLFSELLRRRNLSSLVFCAWGWVMTAQDVHLIHQRLPKLKSLQLTLSSGQPDVQSLQLLAGVDVSLCVSPKDSTCCRHFLQQVCKVPLKRLRITFPAEELTLNVMDLLAKCSSCRELILCFRGPAQHLREYPSGVKIVIKPFCRS